MYYNYSSLIEWIRPCRVAKRGSFDQTRRKAGSLDHVTVMMINQVEIMFYVIQWYAMKNENIMICYTILSYGMRIKWYGSRFLKCYAMLYVVKDMLWLTVP